MQLLRKVKQLVYANMESSQDVLLTFQRLNSVDSILLLVGYAVCAYMYMEYLWKDLETPSNLVTTVISGDRS